MTPNDLATKADLQHINNVIMQIDEKIESYGKRDLMAFEKPMTRKEVAEYLQITVQTVDALRKEGILKHHILGKKEVRFLRQDVLAALHEGKSLKYQRRQK